MALHPGSVQRFPQGAINGPGTGTSDSILARVSNGEYILPKAVVDLVGKKNLDKLRQSAKAIQRAPKYADGGAVDPYGNDRSLTDSLNRAVATTQETNKFLQGGNLLSTAPTAPAPAPSLSSAYSTAKSNADPLDVASGRFDRGFNPPTMAKPSTPLSTSAAAQRFSAYSTAKSNADPLDVASGRFDRGYQVPRFAEGGIIGYDPNERILRALQDRDLAAKQQKLEQAIQNRNAATTSQMGELKQRYAPSPSTPVERRPVDVQRAAKRLLGDAPVAAQQGAYSGAAGTVERVPVRPDGGSVLANQQLAPIKSTGLVPALGSSPSVISTGETAQSMKLRVPVSNPSVIEGEVIPRSVERPLAVDRPGVTVGSVPAGQQLSPVVREPVKSAPASGKSWQQTLAEKSIANRFQATNQAEAARAAAKPAPPPVASPPTPGFFSKAGSFLAGGAVPTYATSIATAIDATQNPANARVSDAEIARLAEEDPVRAQLTFGKDRIAQAFSKPVKQKGPDTVKYGETPKNRLPTAVKPAIDPSQAASDKRVRDLVMKDREPYRAIEVPELQEQAKKFQNDGYTFNTPEQGAPIAGNSALYKDIADPTGNDNRTRAVVPGKGYMELQRSRGLPAGASGQRGGFAGSATDAEAARNLQSRAEQDQAARFMVDSMNRGAEAERDTRATKLGVSRAVLDQMEGRMDSPAVQAMQQRQAAQAPYEAMESAQRAYQDELGAIAAMRSSAPRGRPGDKLKREAVYKEADARASAAENLLNASLGVGSKQVDAETNRRRTAAEMEAARVQEAGLNRRAQMQQDNQLQNTKLTQQGQLEREVLQQNLIDQRDAKKTSREEVQETQKALLDRFTQKDKNISVRGSQSEFLTFMTQAGEALKARGFSPEQIQRFADGDFKNRAELNLALGYYDQYLRNEDPWIGSKPTPGETVKLVHPRD